MTLTLHPTLLFAKPLKYFSHNCQRLKNTGTQEKKYNKKTKHKCTNSERTLSHGSDFKFGIESAPFAVAT